MADHDTHDHTGVPGVGGGSGELAYAQVTSGGNITATVEASADTIVTAGAITADGSTAIFVEWFLLGLASPSSQTTYLLLFDGSTSLGYAGLGTSGLNPSISGRRRLTPTAGSHTYSIRGIVTSGTGTFTAGAGGAGNNIPSFIRVVNA